MYNTEVRVQEFVVGDVREPRVSKYAKVFETLKELAGATPPRGLVIQFNSAGAGGLIKHKMAVWAAEDGYDLYVGSPIDGARQFWVKKKENADDEG